MTHDKNTTTAPPAAVPPCRTCDMCGWNTFTCLGVLGAVKYYRCTGCGWGFGLWVDNPATGTRPDTANDENGGV